LDVNQADWKTALKQTNFKGLQVIIDKQTDLKRILGIAGIPKNYLLDKEGKIIAMDLRENELEKSLLIYLINLFTIKPRWVFRNICQIHTRHNQGGRCYFGETKSLA